MHDRSLSKLIARKRRELIRIMIMEAKSFLFPWPDLLVFVRHAESMSNYETDLIKDGVITGYSGKVLNHRDMDVELTENGVWQATQTGIWLRKNDFTFDGCYRSPYTRTRQTSERVYPYGDFREDSRIREKDFGVLEQLTDKEVRELYPELVKLKRKLRKYYFCAPGGEHYPKMQDRAHSFLGTLLRDWGGRRVIIVSHSAIISCFRALIERHSEEDLIRMQKEQPIKNASLTIYRRDKIRHKSRMVLVAPPFAPWEEPNKIVHL
ncbi:histidine phosphatase family protein [Candidatus Kuenenbacteria bacterium]|nr:histidine phosphatase family protein [Candidatus Kuenenbacteria bacterium]